MRLGYAGPGPHRFENTVDRNRVRVQNGNPVGIWWLAGMGKSGAWDTTVWPEMAAQPLGSAARAIT